MWQGGKNHTFAVALAETSLDFAGPCAKIEGGGRGEQKIINFFFSTFFC